MHIRWWHFSTKNQCSLFRRYPYVLLCSIEVWGKQELGFWGRCFLLFFEKLRAMILWLFVEEMRWSSKRISILSFVSIEFLEVFECLFKSSASALKCIVMIFQRIKASRLYSPGQVRCILQGNCILSSLQFESHYCKKNRHSRPIKVRELLFWFEIVGNYESISNRSARSVYYLKVDDF